MKLFLSEQDGHRNRLAAAIRQDRLALSRALFVAVRERACASWKVSQPFEQVTEWGRAHLLTAVDLLAAWFQTRDPLYHELFAGWVHSWLLPNLTEEGAPGDYKPDRAVEFAKVSWSVILKSRVPDEAIQILHTDLDRIISGLSRPAFKTLRILFIGDCVQFEVVTALIGPCAQAQISIKPVVINERVQPVLRDRIRTLGPDEFDLVFFSPFSHAYLPEYEVLLKPGRRFWSAAKIKSHVDAMLKDVCLTVEALAQQLECPIYVHNTAGTIQSFGKVSGFVKNLISRRNRRRTREICNDRIARYLRDPRLEGRVQLLDENSLRARMSDMELGQVYLNSFAYHPTRLGVELGRTLYFHAVYAASCLASRKAVVCDLDNTLWDGVIGEGTVKHYFERQAILQRLRRSGVLLSINSKNNPKNVHWSGAVLQPADFVAPRINWESKVANIASIRDELNLKVKDFVFLDDRPDELEAVQSAFPEILALNATHPTTWKVLSQWQKSLRSDQEQDRTKLYHQRAERQQFLNGLSHEAAPLEEREEALAKQKLTIKIEEVSRYGLRRAAELINRSNQFNLCGSRTTVRELEDGLRVQHWIITAAATDKFGSMGVVGVMRVDRKPDRVEIPIFVLSCRVFGFGIEYALLNAVKSLAPGDHAIVGHYRKTQSNEPCRQLYPKSRMHWDGSSWTGRVGDLPPDPAWLTVENWIPARLSAAMSAH